MPKLSPKFATIVAATAAAGFSGAAIAGAASSASPSTSTPAAAQGATGPRGHHGSGEIALTGDTKAKVEAAALAKAPGTVLRTESDRGGTYESHIRRQDGTEVEVKVGKDFKVTSVETSPAGGRGGHGGRHADLAAVAQALGVTEAKLESAVDAARPDKGATKADKRGEDAAAIAKSLGESTADVQAVIDATRQAGGGRHERGDQSTLVAALVKKFAVSEAKAQAAVDAAHKAHEADRGARETAMYAAIAKTLGKDTAAVQKAFEASRPASATP